MTPPDTAALRCHALTTDQPDAAATDSAAESSSVSPSLPSNATLFGFPAPLMRAVDETFPRNGPCGFCGDTILGARHRVIDGITERLLAGEDEDSTAHDYDLRAADLWVAVAASYEHTKALARQRRAERKAKRDE